MRLNKMICLSITVFFFSSLFFASNVLAQETTSNTSVVVANFDIEFITATDMNIIISMDVSQIKVFGTTYQQGEIQSLSTSADTSDIETMGAIKLSLTQLIEGQLLDTFPNVDVSAVTSRPEYNSGLFNTEYNVNLTSSYLELDDTVDAHNFINGVLDMGAIVNYTFDLTAETGWNNTYIFDLGNSLTFRFTTGDVSGTDVEWSVKNWNGNRPSKTAKLELMKISPTTSDLDSEDIFLNFELNSEEPENVKLNTNVLINSASIESYDVLPDFISRLDYITADGLRLFIDNSLITWNETYEKTIQPIENIIIAAIEGSSFNQDLDIEFIWDEATTTLIDTPYNISKMDNTPPVTALLTDSDIDLTICRITSRALLGLINTGAQTNISATDVNFGDNLSNIGYDYNVTLSLPNNLYLDGENVYSWNESSPASGEFSSEIKKDYSKEEKSTEIIIDVKNIDLNLLSFFTGKTEMTFGIDIDETKNYNVTQIPDQFILPEKVSIDYLDADAFKLCVQENVFDSDSVNTFLNSEKEKYISRLKGIIPNLAVSGNIKRDAFDKSIENWDGNISNMGKTPPVNIGFDSYSSYPVQFDFSILPPSADIPEKTFTFEGFTDQNVTYKMIFPKGVSVSVNDEFGKARIFESNGREYIEISFTANETNLTSVVTCKITPSAMFMFGIFTPCIVSLIITLILVIVIFIIRRKRKRGKPSKKPVVHESYEEEDLSNYEEEDYYVPPPPKSK